MIRKNRNIIKRSRLLFPGKRGGGPVIYWMDRDQRIADNWALLFAQQEALVRKKDLRILFFVSPEGISGQSSGLPFQLHGLAELKEQAKEFNIDFTIIKGKAQIFLPRYLQKHDCHLLVTDFSPLRSKQQMCRKIGREIAVPFFEVDAHNIIPSWIVTTKKEYAAYTLRPKATRLLPEYLTGFPELVVHPFANPSPPNNDFPDITEKMGPMLKEGLGTFSPGCRAALSHMEDFLINGLDRYTEERNNPNLGGQSGLSPYLHFGQLAPQRLAWEVSRTDALQAGKDGFLEELIVRRELADNFCLYESCYDSFEGFPSWAQKTLDRHRDDTRKYIYTLDRLENGETHEALWNSCQWDMMSNHKLHGFLRMYWAKKILEWTANPEDALHHAIYLNDKYSIDGYDPNGYTGIAWSLGGVHDRAWPEREVFGKIRYMNERGCRRKFNVECYIAEHGTAI